MTLDSEGDNTRNGESNLPEPHARHLLPLSPQFGGSHERQRDSGQAPDVSEPYEALIWRSKVYGGIRIPLGHDMARFVERRLPEIRAGVRGRGRAELRDTGDLVVHFALTPQDIESSLFDAYVAALRNYLSLAGDNPVEVIVRETNLSPEARAATEGALQALGPRAIALSPISNELTTNLDDRS